MSSDHIQAWGIKRQRSFALNRPAMELSHNSWAEEGGQVTTDEIKAQIEYLLQEINPVELIQFSSFLNMICQSSGSDMSMTRGIGLLKEARLIPQSASLVNRLLFHRENVLNLIGQIVSGDIKGTNRLTGIGHLTSQQQYARTILLINDLINSGTNNSATSSVEALLKDHLIREWPHY